MRETLVLVLSGVAIGSLGALATTRVLANLPFGLAPYDPTTILASAALLIVCASLAGYLPARRATRVDPMTALRYD
jgi:ABC-type antimicrobial peptide transport system permease subunit